MPAAEQQSNKPPRKPPGNTGRTHFKPGNKFGNGRPKGLATLVREHTKDGHILVALNLQILQGRLTVERRDADGNAYKVGPTIADRQRALEWLADRGFGKSIDVQMDVTAGDDQRQLAVQIARELAKNPPLSSPSPEIKTPPAQS